MSGKSKKELQPRAVELLSELYVLMKNPSVSNDPVVKALVQGLHKKDDDFKTASLIVASLRNAGCVNQAHKDVPREVTTKNTPKNPQVKGKPDPVKPPEKKLRGLARSLDYLVATNIIDIDGPEITSLRALRKEKDKIIKIKKMDESVIDRKISAIDDFDLLFLLDSPAYNSLMKKIGNPKAIEKMTRGGFNDPFGYWNQNTGASGFISSITELINDGKEKLIFQDGVLGGFATDSGKTAAGGYSYLAQTLKGNVMNTIIEYLKKNAIPEGKLVPSTESSLYLKIAEQLLRENWWKFGKSPTLKALA